MSNELKLLEIELKVLCIKFICILNDLKKRGLLSEEQYLKHITLKKKFLQDKL